MDDHGWDEVRSSEGLMTMKMNLLAKEAIAAKLPIMLEEAMATMQRADKTNLDEGRSITSIGIA